MSVTILVALSLTAFSGSVSAAPPTDGWTGACHMMRAWPGYSVGVGVGVQPGGGMENAMTRNLNGNGNDGMTRAVINSGC